MRAGLAAGGARRRAKWARYTDEQLLDLRLCDLKLPLRGTVLERRVAQVRRELEHRGLRFRPHFWLSDEWFTPDGVAGAAIPFYLAHPRLTRLEENQVLEAEGRTRKWCMQLLRHEVGHAICNAYRLNRRRDWRETFGKSSQPYPKSYVPKPYSRRFVIHLGYWYAQSHPTEDFAETFAVWLTPRLRWRQRFAGWPALRKLHYVDGLMKEIARKRPVAGGREVVHPLREIRTTLRTHYRRKRQRYVTDLPKVYDRDLQRLFDESGPPRRELAARFLQRMRPELRRLVARWTGAYRYTIDQVFRDMIRRCRELKLRVSRPEEETKLEMAILLSVHAVRYLNSGYHEVAL